MSTESTSDRQSSGTDTSTEETIHRAAATAPEAVHGASATPTERATSASVCDLELKRLRPRVSKQRDTIVELEATVEDLRAQLERRDAELAALRDEIATEDDDRDESHRRVASHRCDDEIV